jgi:hypothetical protein
MKALQYGLLTVSLCLFPWTGLAQQFGDFSYSSDGTNITITKYTGVGGTVAIPSMIAGLPVVSIGSYSFSSCPGLTNVTIPNSVTSIGYWAFYVCSGLTSVTIGSSVTSIVTAAFSSCSGLTVFSVEAMNASYSSLDGVLFNKSQTALIQFPRGKIGSYTIPNSVTNTGEGAFSYCSGLTNVTIPNSVTSIGSYSFSSCSGLTNITIPNSVTSIGYRAFFNCSGLTSVTLPNNLTNTGDSAFWGCSNLTSVTFPNSVTTIGNNAFFYCTNLNSLTIPNSVTSIGGSAFYNCSGLTNVTIPNSVTSIGSQAFYNCTKLGSMFFRGNAPAVGNGAIVSPTVCYYLPGASGWSASYGGRPAYLWNPAPQTADAKFGIRTNRFGFNITGTTNIPLVVEASTNLANAAWVPLQTCRLTNGLIYFSDPAWTSFPTRAYRIRSP